VRFADWSEKNRSRLVAFLPLSTSSRHYYHAPPDRSPAPKPIWRVGFILGRHTPTYKIGLTGYRTRDLMRIRRALFRRVLARSIVDICGHFPHMYRTTTLPPPIPHGHLPDRSTAPKPMWRMGCYLRPWFAYIPKSCPSRISNRGPSPQ
jgi:hypothetical protein